MATTGDLFGGSGSKPKLITLITSGTGTHIPTVDNARCFVRMQAPGGGGSNFGSSPGSGAGAGAMVEFWVRVPIAGTAYAIGAPGTAGLDGGVTKFGPMSALGGKGGVSNGGTAQGGLLGDTAGAGVPGVSGGAPGKPPGFSAASTSATGGDSFFGLGGASGNPGAAGSGFGSGGGAGNVSSALGGPGAVGKLEVWDYGA